MKFMVIFASVFLASTVVTLSASAQKSIASEKIPLMHIREYSRKQNKFVVAEVSEETYKALTAPIRSATAKEWDRSTVQNFFGQGAEEQKYAVVFNIPTNPYTPVFQMNASFKRDKDQLGKIRDLLSSFTPEQWKGLKESGYNYPAALLTAEQKQLLRAFVARDNYPDANRSDATYELDFRTWIAVRSADGIDSDRVLQRTVTPK